MDRTVSTRRKASRAVRCEQLIEATILTLARRGLAGTTLSAVAKEAGVSHGLVLFYFESKDRLIAEVLRFMSETHRRNWETEVARAGPDPARRLDALIRAEFDAEIYSSEWQAAWCVFWGESQSWSLYLEHASDNDRAYNDAYCTLCGELARTGGYDLDPRYAGRVLRLTIEGVWIEQVVTAQPYSREEAQRTAYFCAAMLFPRHFTPDGLISR